MAKTKRRMGGAYGHGRTVVTYRLFGVLPVFRRTRAPRSGRAHDIVVAPPERDLGGD